MLLITFVLVYLFPLKISGLSVCCGWQSWLWEKLTISWNYRRAEQVQFNSAIYIELTFKSDWICVVF